MKPTDFRYRLVQNGKIPLNRKEAEEGWHFCPDWDYMLIHPSWPEDGGCTCGDSKFYKGGHELD